MESRAGLGAGAASEQAFRAALARFGQLLQGCWEYSPESLEAGDVASLAAPLATELEAWLRQGMPALTGWTAQWLSSYSNERTPQLLLRWMELQGRLAGFWSVIARTAAERFTARMAQRQETDAPRAVRQLYDAWIECAEEAYASVAHSEEYGRVQAELINTTIGLLLEQRRHVEMVAQAVGVATRSEMDALQRQLRELRREQGASRNRRRAGTRRKRGVDR